MNTRCQLQPKNKLRTTPGEWSLIRRHVQKTSLTDFSFSCTNILVSIRLDPSKSARADSYLPAFCPGLSVVGRLGPNHVPSNQGEAVNVRPVDGVCRSCGGPIQITDFDDCSMTVTCVEWTRPSRCLRGWNRLNRSGEEFVSSPKLILLSFLWGREFSRVAKDAAPTALEQLLQTTDFRAVSPHDHHFLSCGPS